MTETVMVLGSGYVGAGAIRSLQDALGHEADLTWVSEVDYHLVLHESHRCIQNPDVREHVTVPVDDIKAPNTTFLQARVTGIDCERRVVELEDDELAYDYLLVGLGSRTAFFEVDGLEEHAHTLNCLDDALGIHDALAQVADEATPEDPATVVVGGAGLTGIQVAGEVAEFRDEHDVPIEIRLIEGLEEIFPGHDESVQSALRSLLEERDVIITTGEFIGSVDEGTVHVGEDGSYDHDLLVWTGGIAGHKELADAAVEKHERNVRFETDPTFQTSDERVFALGDAALVEQGENDHAPPTAQAAWQAATVAGENVARAVRGQPLEEWRYSEKGTVVSVGDDAVAHDVYIVPFVSTFSGVLARTLKKIIAVRWIRNLTDTPTAMAAWSEM